MSRPSLSFAGRGGTGAGPPRPRVFDSDDDADDAPPPPKRRLVTLDDDGPPVSRPAEDDDDVGALDDDDVPRPAARLQQFVRAADPDGRAGAYNPGARGYGKPLRDFEDGRRDAPPAGAGEDDEDDPLDSFMAGIDKEVKVADAKPKPVVDRYEEEDEIESYVKFMKDKGVEIGKSKPGDEVAPGDVDSDEEVYRTAAAVDAALAAERDEGDGPGDGKKRDIEPLPPVNHDAIGYLDIAKDFYEEHEEIAALSDADVDRIRREMGMRVTGADVPRPCVSFAHFGFDDALLRTISKHGYTEPTAIQRQAVPAGLSGRDMIGIATTGSGKTAAFLWPMIVHIMDQPDLEKGDGPIGLVLAPTRELAQQIYAEAKKFGKAYDLGVSLVYGGASKGEQFKELRAGGVAILIATPGRLIDMVKMKATNLRRVSFLVLDEADRMFDLGFEPQVRSICNNVRPDRQTLLFSATFPRKIEHLARDVLTDPVKIVIGNVAASNTDITQHVEVLEDTFKWGWMIPRLPRFMEEGQGFDAEALHGDLMQHERDTIISNFKKQKFNILVATDVVGRGLDIPAVRNVINYDVPKDIDTHVHRIGRTGRAGVKGNAWSLVTPKEDHFAGLLVRNLEESGQIVPSALLSLAHKNSRFRQRGGGRGRRGGRGGAGMRGRGGLGHGSGPAPAEERAQWRPEQRHADMATGARSGGGAAGSGSGGPARPSFGGMAFTKATTSEGKSTSSLGK
ncbi:P-loop containing nucleoside triphosphate hydrolase protein [Hyaloraphidium curvatum]|nr:P-loop containing nucleoside triphosphate hydrolase protein [Hyaloraphidium curvatum]